MKTYEVIGKITDLNRLNNSVNGNPRFTVVINGQILCTKSDYSYNYNIENLFRKGCKVVAKCYDTKLSTRIEDIRELK